MGDKLKDNVIRWVQFDNEINKYKSEIAVLKEKMNNITTEKEKFESNIIKIMEDNKIQKKDIVISDGKIKYSQSKTANPISCIQKYFKNEDKATELIDYIYKNRDINVKTSIKRTITK